MQFDFEEMSPLERYKLLLATVLPRPIAWITTRDASGAINAAPFSFFNVFGNDPATVGIGIGSKGPREPRTRAPTFAPTNNSSLISYLSSSRKKCG